MSRPVRSLCLALGLTIGWAALGVCEDKPDPKLEEDWQVTYIGKQRIGYLHSVQREVQTGGVKTLVTDVIAVNSIKRFGATARIIIRTRSIEDQAGNLQRVEAIIDNKPGSLIESVGVVKGTNLEFTTTSAGRAKTTQIPWAADIKSVSWQDRYLRENPLKVGESFTFKTFEPQLAKIGDVTITMQEPAAAKLLDGTEPTLDRATVEMSFLPGVTTTVFVDEQGRSLKTEVPLLQMTSYGVTSTEALKEIPTDELDVGLSTLIKVPGLKGVHHRPTTTYRIESSCVDPSKLFPVGCTQQVQKSSNTVAEITVQQVPQGTDPAPSDEYLQSTAFLDHEAPKVRELAKRGAEGTTTQYETAIALEKFLKLELKNKNFSTAMATASEVADSLSGDCTEHAVLLAAMLRARQIPARVAVGLVYAEKLEAFGGHMWTEAYLDGHWLPLDATLGLGGICSGHLKVADSSLLDNAPAPVTALLPTMHLWGGTKIEVVGQ